MKNQFNNLMLDLETMGTTNNSAIVAIDAVSFDINSGQFGNEFYRTVNLQSCLLAGLEMNASTILWWLRQSEEARSELSKKDGIPLIQALSEFSDFCENKNYTIWGNSASFDCGILANAYNKAAIEIPWKFWNERCLRTLANLRPEIKDLTQSVGTAHNALDDCKFQINYCTKIFKSINNLT